MAYLTISISAVLLFTCSVLVNCESNFDYMQEFQKYKAKFNKHYNSSADEEKAFEAFKINFKFVNDHNKKYRDQKVKFFVEINKFSDMTINDFVNKLNIFRLNSTLNVGAHGFYESSVKDKVLPDSYEWISRLPLYEIKDQGDCGSSWAFAAAGAIEAQENKKTGKLVPLSAQNIIDCSSRFGNLGCGGGTIDWAFNYVESYGIATEKSYPYEGRTGSCRFNPTTIGATIKGYKFIKQYDEEELKRAVYEIGPIPVHIDANSLSFMHYKGGIYSNPNCRKDDLTRAMLIVGYFKDLGEEYWMLKNSLGKDWGTEGFMLLKRNSNECGIASRASYPVKE